MLLTITWRHRPTHRLRHLKSLQSPPTNNMSAVCTCLSQPVLSSSSSPSSELPVSQNIFTPRCKYIAGRYAIRSCLMYCRSHAGIVLKWLNVSSNVFRRRAATPFQFVTPKCMAIFRKGPSDGGVECRGHEQIVIFDQCLVLQIQQCKSWWIGIGRVGFLIIIIIILIRKKN